MNEFETSSASSLQDELAMKLASLMANTSDFIYFKDAQCRFSLVSEAMIEQIAGMQDAPIVGKTDFDFCDQESAQKIYDDDQKVLTTGEPIRSKVEVVHFDNAGVSWMSTSKMPLKDSDGNIVGLMGISRDITNEKMVEKELEKTNSELVAASRRAGMAEVATNVIHNVGNVLNSINVSISKSADVAEEIDFGKLEKIAELIETGLNSPGFTDADGKGRLIPDYLRKLAGLFQSENTLLRDELAATRRHLEHVSNIISRQQQYASNFHVVEKVDLSELLEDAIRMSSTSLTNHRINVVKDYEPGLILEVDKHRVLQIIVNLIRNAKFACIDSGYSYREIKISVQPNDTQGYEIQVQDNGVGIAPENIVKLFNHGFTTRPDGHGFGLHSGANSAKQMNGSLTAHSEGLGRGATFKLSLPDARLVKRRTPETTLFGEDD